MENKKFTDQNQKKDKDQNKQTGAFQSGKNKPSIPESEGQNRITNDEEENTPVNPQDNSYQKKQFTTQEQNDKKDESWKDKNKDSQKEKTDKGQQQPYNKEKEEEDDDTSIPDIDDPDKTIKKIPRMD